MLQSILLAVSSGEIILGFRSRLEDQGLRLIAIRIVHVALAGNQGQNIANPFIQIIGGSINSALDGVFLLWLETRPGDLSGRLGSEREA